MQTEDCFLIGTIFKLHGFKGEIRIYNNDNISINFSFIKYLFVKINGILIPYFIENARNEKNNAFVVKLESIDSEDKAKKLLNKEVYLKQEYSPIKGKKNENIIGFSVIDTEKGFLGKVSRVNKKTAQNIIYVMRENQDEFCFPSHENFIKNIDKNKNIIEVVITEEIISLNKK